MLAWMKVGIQKEGVAFYFDVIGERAFVQEALVYDTRMAGEFYGTHDPEALKKVGESMFRGHTEFRHQVLEMARAGT